MAVVVGRIPARQGSYARRRQIGFYHTEKPAKYAHLPARMVLAQKARCHARLSRSFQLAEVCGTVSTAGVFAWRTALKHKFTVGETVYFTASNVARPAASGTYEVIRLLPTDGDDCQYRIKNSTEAFERVARESQLDIS